MLISNENVPNLFAPFREAIGASFDKVCNDARALYGRVDKDIKAEGGDWKVKGKVAKGEVANKSVYTLFLPAGNALTHLTLAALDAREFAKRHTIPMDEMNIALPKACVAYITDANKNTKEQKQDKTKEPVNA